MSKYRELADSVVIKTKNNKPILTDFNHSLSLIGTGRSAYVFRIKHNNKAIKIFFPTHQHYAHEEAIAYELVKNVDYFANIYEYGSNYVVIDYIEGYTLFDCLTRGIHISTQNVKEVDTAISLAQNLGLNPSDIHLRNIIITTNKEIKMIDIARFRQTDPCPQWSDLKTAFHHLYNRRLFPKRIPSSLLNVIAYFYKKYFYRANLSHYLKQLQ